LQSEDGSSKSYFPACVRGVIDSSLLYTMVVYDMDLEETSLKTISGKVLLDHFRKQTGVLIASCVEPSALFSNWKFKHYSDPAQGVHEIFAQARSIISANGLSDLFAAHEDIWRKQVYAIVNVLYLRIFCESVKTVCPWITRNADPI
jgi:hypothetical protein